MHCHQLLIDRSWVAYLELLVRMISPLLQRDQQCRLPTARPLFTAPLILVIRRLLHHLFFLVKQSLCHQSKVARLLCTPPSTVALCFTLLP